MKFGKTLSESILKEWRFYSVDYKSLKKSMKAKSTNTDVSSGESSDSEESWTGTKIDTVEFFYLLEESEMKLSKFYHEKENWALMYIKTLEQRVEELRACSPSPLTPSTQPKKHGHHKSLSSAPSVVSIYSDFSSDSDNELDQQYADCVAKETSCVGMLSNEWLKSQYRQMGKCEHFQKYIYAKKSLTTFDRELELILDFLDLNKTAFFKILKKFDKKNGTNIREDQLARLYESHKFLFGDVIRELKDKTLAMIDEVNALKPALPEGWENRKVYTIGCFDLFHRGHQNVLMALREFGCYIVAGVHDDESYFKLKNKYTIDNLETRIENAKPYVDQMFVIPSTDPLLYVKSMVSQADIDSGACCYARGDDMLNFPGREWIESVMPVHFVPRTEACSSTLIRTIYHAEDEETRNKAAFAKTRYDGKPIDENGNVLRLSKVSS